MKQLGQINKALNNDETPDIKLLALFIIVRNKLGNRYETEEQVHQLIELYNERAAIMEYDGGMTRHEAERLAWRMIFENQN